MESYLDSSCRLSGFGLEKCPTIVEHFLLFVGRMKDGGVGGGGSSRGEASRIT